MTHSAEADRFPGVVIGAGMAGLTAAVHLAERGIPPLVLEADRLWPGGRMAGGAPDTFEYAGRTWAFDSEHGMHALWGSYDNLHTLIMRTTDLTLNPSPGEEWINRWGRDVRVIEAGNAVRSRWIPAPFHHLQLLFDPGIWAAITPLDFLSLPGLLFSILMTVGMDPLAEELALDGLMMDEFFRGWTPNLRATFTGLGVNLLAAPKEKISLTAFIAALRFYTLLRRDSWVLHYLPAPPHECLLKPLIDFIEDHEGMVMMGATAQRLERSGEGWRITIEDSVRGGMRSLLAERVILAVQPPAAQRLLMNSPDTTEAAAQIRFPEAVQNATVRLWFNASPREGTPGGMLTGDFLPDNFFWMHRLYAPFREWHEVTGGSALEMHVYADQRVLSQPENVLLIQCLDEAQRAFPNLRGHFVHGTVRLNTLDQTLLRIPTRESLWLNTPWPNLYACGDWIGYPTPSLWLERSTVTGIAAANAVLQAHGLEPFPIQSPRSPEAPARVLEAAVRLFRRTLGRVILRGGRAIQHRR
ncbi:MAG: NAD(P)-binding protein [Anaerolineae bacterium]|nr:NAD(P)-binding protein [Anaerolineae bacterium]